MVQAAAVRLRAEVEGALSPNSAYEVVMDQFMADPEAFRCVPSPLPRMMCL